MMIDVSKNIVMKPIGEVKPYVRNPRKNEKTVKVLCDIIPIVGFNQPIVVDKRGIIVKGHARYAAAVQLGMTEVPCIVTDADDEAIKLDRIADNKISELSEWINDELLHEVDMLNIDFDLEELGLPSVTFDDFPEFEAEEAEDKSEIYKRYLEEHKDDAPAVVITDQKAIDVAKQKQKEVPDAPKKYYKVVCEHCGYTMFVEKNNFIEL